MTDRSSASTRTGAEAASARLAAMRADALHRLLVSPRGLVARADQIPALPDLAGWDPGLVAAAIADLVADGRLSEDAHGRLAVAPHPAGAA